MNSEKNRSKFPPRGWLWFVAFILLLVAIGFGGPALSSYIDKRSREKIKMQGVVLRAKVFLKKTHKGNTVHFKYEFRNKLYRNNEQGDYFFDKLSVGDSIDIVIDSTHPSSSYIIE